MIRVEKKLYDKVVKWAKGARNYIGIEPHSVDFISHQIKNEDGNIIIVAEEGPDDFSDEYLYFVHEAVYKVWKAKTGYTITL